MDKKIDLYIIGAGGLGKEVLWHIEDNSDMYKDYDVKGFIDDGKDIGLEINGKKILGRTDYLLDIDDDIAVVIAIGNPNIRKQKYDMIKHKSNFSYPNIFPRDLSKSSTVDFGKGNIILNDAKFTVNIEIGDFNLIYIQCVITHDVVIKNFVSLYTGVIISGSCVIEDLCELGTGVRVIQNINIARKTVIGAGAVVVKDTEGDEVLVGIPAKKISRIEDLLL